MENYLEGGKVRESFYRALVILFPIQILVLIGTLLCYPSASDFTKKYMTDEKAKYQILSKVQQDNKRYYFILRNIKTKKKIIKECEFEYYALFKPGG